MARSGVSSFSTFSGRRRRHGGWAGIVPHTFLDLFGPAQGIVTLDLVEPAHNEAIGLVLSDRDPQSPMASALLASKPIPTLPTR